MKCAVLTRKRQGRAVGAQGDLISQIRLGPPAAPLNAEHEYGTAVEDALRATLSAEQRLLVRAALLHRHLALGDARAGRVASADARLDHAGRMLDPHHLPEGPGTLVASELTAVRAYVAHRRQDPAQAVALVRRVLALDLRLVDRQAWSFAELHRVQQLHNLARIALRHGDLTAATNLLAGTLAYLAGRPDAWPLIDEPGRPRALADMPSAWRGGMAAQLVGELAIWEPRLTDGELAGFCRQSLARAGHRLDELGPPAEAARCWLVAHSWPGHASCLRTLAADLALLRAAPLLWWATALAAAARLRREGGRSAALASFIESESRRQATGMTSLLAAHGLGPQRRPPDWGPPDGQRPDQQLRQGEDHAWCRP